MIDSNVCNEYYWRFSIPILVEDTSKILPVILGYHGVTHNSSITTIPTYTMNYYTMQFEQYLHHGSLLDQHIVCDFLESPLETELGKSLYGK